MNHVNAVISSISTQVSIRKNPVKALIPCAVECFKDSFKATAGIIATPFSAITCGKFKTINQWSDLTSKGKEILPKIFKVAMTIVNPLYSQNLIIEDGLFAEPVSKKINLTCYKLKYSGIWFNNNITLRALKFFSIPVLTLTRTADGLLALPAVAVSVLTLGNYKEINGFASNQLISFGSIFSDVSSNLRAAFNPSSVSILGKSINI